jgi:hypothetical protein
MSNEVEELRTRAQWYRDFAQLGTPDERVWRFQMADYFDRMADGAEKRGPGSDDQGLRAE